MKDCVYIAPFIVEFQNDLQQKGKLGSNAVDVWHKPGWCQVIILHQSAQQISADVQAEGIIKPIK